MMPTDMTARAAAINLRHLRLFCHIADQGTQRGAAAASGLSQPALSQAIANLEKQFGIQLFQRSRHGMSLAPAAESLHQRIVHMLGYIGRMHRWVADPITFDNRLTIMHLRVLVEINRLKGYTPAARSIGVAVPTVHRAERNLARIAGVTIFERVNNVIEATAAGDELSRLAGLALKELTAAFEDLDDRLGRAAGTITLGAMPLARTDILPDAIGDLCEQNTMASIEMVEADYDSLLRMLRRGELDIFLGAARGRDAGSDVIEHPLFEDGLSVFARAGHPLEGRRNLSIDELAAYPWIAPRPGAPTRRDFDRIFKSCDLPFGLIASSSLVVVRALLARSDRLTLLSRRRILYEEEQGLLVALDADLPLGTRTICATTRRDWRPTRLQQTFLESLTTLFQGRVDGSRRFTPQGRCRPTLFMLMGLPGSGKTTLARQIERDQKALFLEADTRMAEIVRDTFDVDERLSVHRVQLDTARRVLALGVNVVLDFGFLLRADRDAARQVAQDAEAEARLIFLDPPIKELVRRLEARNKALPPNSFHTTREHLERCMAWLERPDADENVTPYPGSQPPHR